MRFRRWPRVTSFHDTPRKRAALARSQRAQREKLPLLRQIIAEQQPAADEIMVQRAQRWSRSQQDDRDRRAQLWRRARTQLAGHGDNFRALFEIPTNTGQGEYIMKTYRIVYAAYVRMYAEHTIEAENDDAARQLAIEDFKVRGPELQWLDADYENLALPSIVGMQTDDTPGDVLEGYDFPATPADARQYAAAKLLAALENLMPDIENEIDQRQESGIDEEWIELDRKAADARAAIAEATAIKD